MLPEAAHASVHGLAEIVCSAAFMLCHCLGYRNTRPCLHCGFMELTSPAASSSAGVRVYLPL